MRTVSACLLASLLLMTGCAVGKAANGRIVIGLGVSDSGQIETPTETLKDAASFLPPPWDKAAVGLIGLGAAAYGRERGRHTGWDEATTVKVGPGGTA